MFFMINFELQALNRLGLRVVMDVVYNHLYSSGPFAITSVLDKVASCFLVIFFFPVTTPNIKSIS
jgi:glycosidase